MCDQYVQLYLSRPVHPRPICKTNSQSTTRIWKPVLLSLKATLWGLLSLVSLQSQAIPVISEVYYDQPGADGSQVFTELWGTPGFSLNGWSLVGVNGYNNNLYRSIDLHGTKLNAEGLLLISTAEADTELAALSHFTANIDWQNGVDAIQLIAPDAGIYDSLQYGTLVGFSVAEGQAAEDAPAGFSLSRSFANVDTQSNASDFSITAPTPGTVNLAPTLAASNATASIDNISTLYLLSLGLIPLLRLGKQGLKRPPNEPH